MVLVSVQEPETVAQDNNPGRTARIVRETVFQRANLPGGIHVAPGRFHIRDFA